MKLNQVKKGNLKISGNLKLPNVGLHAFLLEIMLNYLMKG